MNGASSAPGERLSEEDRINSAQLPGFRVCLHPDRTSSRVQNGYRIECDYCPSFSLMTWGDFWPDIAPRYYREDGTL